MRIVDHDESGRLVVSSFGMFMAGTLCQRRDLLAETQVITAFVRDPSDHFISNELLTTAG